MKDNVSSTEYLLNISLYEMLGIKDTLFPSVLYMSQLIIIILANNFFIKGFQEKKFRMKTDVISQSRWTDNVP